MIRTIVHLRTKDTPFNLVFGSDAVIPIEIVMNTLRMAYFDPKQNESSIRANLDLLEEIKEDASVKTIARERQVS